MKADLLKELDKLIETGRLLSNPFSNLTHSYLDSLTNRRKIERSNFVNSSLTIIRYIAGEDSHHFNSIPQKDISYGLSSNVSSEVLISTITGSLISLRDAVSRDLLSSLESKIISNTHADFLLQAGKLLEAGYHVAAELLIGSVLEHHLQRMLQAYKIDLPNKKGIASYDSLLRQADVYEITVGGRIQSIAHRRNQVAHGNQPTIDAEDVKEDHVYVTRFITTHPIPA